MTKWIIKYTDAYGDLSSVLVEAETKEEATDKAYREYWDIEDILIVKQAYETSSIYSILRLR